MERSTHSLEKPTQRGGGATQRVARSHDRVASSKAGPQVGSGLRRARRLDGVEVEQVGFGRIAVSVEPDRGCGAGRVLGVEPSDDAALGEVRTSCALGGPRRCRTSSGVIPSLTRPKRSGVT